jgi:hypothetical protein
VTTTEHTTETTRLDLSRRTYIDYIDRTREHYLREGFNNPYQWAHFDDVPFVRPRKPLTESRVAVITTAARFQPDKGDQGPHAPYNNDAKFFEVYTDPIDPPPDLRISHIGYDRVNTVPEDIDAYFPLARMMELAAGARVGAVTPRFYGVPTLRSQRSTIERDAPRVLEELRKDGAEVAVLTAV